MKALFPAFQLVTRGVPDAAEAVALVVVVTADTGIPCPAEDTFEGVFGTEAERRFRRAWAISASVASIGTTMNTGSPVKLIIKKTITETIQRTSVI